MHPIPVAVLVVLLAGCGNDEGGHVDLYLDRTGCSPTCKADRFDLFVSRDGCLLAWRHGLTSGEPILPDLAVARGQQIGVDVLARCGSDPCVRCVASATFRVGETERVDLKLNAAPACSTRPRTTTPCTHCVPGPDSYCDGDHRVSCPGDGLAQRTTCPFGCTAGTCDASCVEKTYYQDADGDTHGVSAAQQVACSRPANFAERGGDCDDTDPDVHPGQTAFFTKPTARGGFDYNCDNKPEPEYPSLGSCALDGKTGTCIGAGWTGLVPACGQSFWFTTCVKQLIGCDETTPAGKIQACR